MSTIPQRRTTAPQNKQSTTSKRFEVVTGITRKTWKIGIYGPEGVGKSTLAALCPNAIFADIESSMRDIPCQKIGEGIINTWEDLLAWVASLNDGWAGIDSMSFAENLCAEFVIKTYVGNDGTKGKNSLEDFKYKAGLRFVNDEFKKLLVAIEAANRRGVSWIMTAHNLVKQFKDPENNDYIRHQPYLVDNDKEGISNMRSWVQFLDVCAFIDLDVNVEKRKAKTGGTRTIYLDTSASHISKGRGIETTSIDYIYDTALPLYDAKNRCELWRRIGASK